MSINVLAAIICDEVRQEATGRAIIVGAAPVGPEVRKEEETHLPRIAFYIEAAFSNVDVVLFRLISEDEKDIPVQVEMDLGHNSDAGELLSKEETEVVGTVVFGKEGVTIRSPGKYRLQYSEDQSTWNDVRAFYFPEMQP